MNRNLAIRFSEYIDKVFVFGSLAGRTVIAPKTWNHVALVRNGTRVTLYLNGNTVPELIGEAAPDPSQDLFVGGRSDKGATFEGRIDEVAIYNHALSPQDLQRHYQLAGADAGVVVLRQ